MIRSFGLFGALLAVLVFSGTVVEAKKGRPTPADSTPDIGYEGVTLDLSDESNPRTVSLGDLTVRVEERRNGDETTPTFIIEYRGHEQMRFDGEPTYFGFLPGSVTIAQLEPFTPEFEVITTTYTGGAHCCDRIQVAWIQPEGTWWLEEFGMYDGGFYLSDHNDDGVAEITVRDQSFLYTFDAYAGSWAPPQIFVLDDGVVKEVSADPAYASAFREELGDFVPEQNLDRPGGLAGWAALQARLGNAKEALERLRLANATVDWPYQVCVSGGSRFDCADKDLRSLTFVEFLEYHLIEQGYMEAPQ